MRPFFSIIIPAYDREALITRALRSCSAQSFADFEVVVVDDASQDGTAEVVRAYDDPRVRLIVHERNRGCCPARNTGMAAAGGEWFVFLDSDDELLPGALETIHRRATEADPRVGGLRFMCVDDYGTSPVPPHEDQILDYEGFVRWLELVFDGKQEALPCARASTFPAVRYADSHAYEGFYHLELARTSLVQACRDVVRRYYHDAPERLTVPVPERALRYAADVASDADRVLEIHGRALARWAPRVHWLTIAGAASASFMAGRRKAGLRYALMAVRSSPLSPRIWTTTIVGLLGRRPLALLQAWKARALLKLVG